MSIPFLIGLIALLALGGGLVAFVMSRLSDTPRRDGGVPPGADADGGDGGGD